MNKYIAIYPINATLGIGALEIDSKNKILTWEYYGINTSGDYYQITIPSKTDIKLDRDTNTIYVSICGNRIELKKFEPVKKVGTLAYA